MTAQIPQQDNASLRSDVRHLGELLGQSLSRQDGEALLNLVELVRKSVREGSGEDLLNSISTADSVKLVRAFNVYFNLANVAEQVHRSRVLAHERNTGGSWLTHNALNVEYNISATSMVGGEHMLDGFFGATNQSTTSEDANAANFAFQLGRTNSDTPVSDVFVLSVRTVSGTGNVKSSLGWFDLL